MSNEVLKGQRRGGSADGSLFAASVSEQNDLLIALGLPPYADLTRRGLGWSVKTATAFTSQVVLPATVANLEIKNNHATSLMVIDTIFSWQIIGSAVAEGYSVWAQVGTPVIASIDSLVVYSANGSASYVSGVNADVSTDTEQTVVANGWRQFPGSTTGKALNAATPGGGLVGEVGGRLIVPPGKALHIAVSGSIATATGMHCGASWFLIPGLTNET